MHKSTIVIETESTLTQLGADTQKNKYFPEFSILVACIGAHLGVVSMNVFIAQTNQQINAVIPNNDISKYYLFFLLEAIKPTLEAIGGGATMPNMLFLMSPMCFSP